MKKIKSHITLVAIAITSMLMFSMCMEKDSTSPHIILDGKNPYRIDLNDRYIEAYYQIYDNRDDSAELTVEIVNEIDTLEEEDGFFDAAGDPIYMGVGATIQHETYTIEYTVTDKAGNIAVASREVIVTNEIDAYAKNYTVEKLNLTNPDQTYEDYLQQIDFDEAVNNRLWVSKFSNLESIYNLTVYMDVRGDSIFIPRQTFVDQNAYVIEGKDDMNNGFAGLLDRNAFTFTIEYTASKNPGPGSPATEDFMEIFKKTEVE
jgi:hypothetical protein